VSAKPNDGRLGRSPNAKDYAERNPLVRRHARANILPQSLRVQLLAGLLVPLTAIVFLNLTLARNNALEMANIVLDRSLFLSAAAIADHVQAHGKGFDVFIPPFALGELRSPENDITYYRVNAPNGDLLAGYSDIPDVPSRPIGSGPRYEDVVFHGASVRFVAIRKLVFVGHAALGAFVTVGETLRSRDAMVQSLERQAALQQGGLAFIAAVLAWLGLRRDLAPLVRLGKEVKKRIPGDLAPLPAAAVQRELRPFVTALNDHLAQQRQQLEAQRRFAANAAHQLRTPLTLLRMQADYALRETENEKRSGAIVALTATTDRMTRLAKQLLRLSEAESQLAAASREPIDLAELAREVLEGYAGIALSRDIDLGLEASGAEPVLTIGDPTMVREVMLNLVDNALRYVPAGGVVTVALSQADMCVLRVEDNGPGVPVAERELVFERFYRVLGSRAEGSGLGLAIVKEIVESSGGSVALADPRDGSGLVVEVRLRRFDRAPAPV
jgi:two-component system sensor histidine kinase TctE